MKKFIVLVLSSMFLLVSFSIALAGPSDTPASSWQQEFATTAKVMGLDQAIINARAEGRTVLEIISAALAARYGVEAIVTSLAHVGTGQGEIVSAAAQAGLDMKLVTATLHVLAPGPALNHPAVVAGGSVPPQSASPATF